MIMATLIGTAGNDILVGGSFSDSLVGLGGNDLLEGQLGADTLDGGAGWDTASYFDNAGVQVYLWQNYAVDAGGSVDRLFGIENVNGSNSADVIVGDSNPNILRGLGGDDRIEGQLGADTIDGGTGTDLVSYFDNASVEVYLWQNYAVDAQGGIDLLMSIEDVNGSNSADVIVGHAGANRLNGLGGDDRIEGQLGADTIDGGTGRDLVSYFDNAGVQVYLWQNYAMDAGGSVDRLFNIEDVNGSNSADVIVGDAGANRLNGLGGDDALEGQLGADTIDGGAGTDLVSYFDNAAVNVQLWQGFAVDAGGSTDRLIGIENVNGSNSADVIAGDNGANLLRGLGGNDLIEGQLGADTVDGGDGVDTVSYFDNAGVTVSLATGSATDAGGSIDTLLGIENVNGSNSNDVITGDAAANRLNGLGGNDLLEGGAGRDRLLGGTGDDTLTGGASPDILNGGAGADLFRYGFANEGRDTIQGFVSGLDGFEIDASGFRGGLTAGMDLGAAGRFVEGTAATAAFGQFIYDTGAGRLFWDVDGTGTRAAAVIADLGAGTALVASDFTIVA